MPGTFSMMCRKCIRIIKTGKIMGMKRKLCLNFKETKDSDLAMLAFTVVNNMTGNDHFPDPDMLIIELRETGKQFFDAVADSRSRDLEKIAHKNNLRVILIKKLKEVGEFVKIHAKEAELPLITSGFTLIRPADEIILNYRCITIKFQCHISRTINGIVRNISIMPESMDSFERCIRPEASPREDTCIFDFIIGNYII